MGGYVVNLDSRNSSESMSILKKLKDGNWISPFNSTRYLSITYNVYNANANLFGIVELGVEFWPTGGALSNVDVTVINLFPTPTDYWKEYILFIGVLVCFSIRSYVEIKEFSYGYVECFMDEENYISKIKSVNANKVAVATLARSISINGNKKLRRKQSMARDGRIQNE